MYSTYNEGKSVVAERLLERSKTRFLSTWQLSQKNVYFDVLDDIINKYNNTIHGTMKMKPINITFNSYAEYNEDSNKKYPKMLQFQNTKTFLLKDTLQIGQKFLLLLKLKIQFLGLM